MIKRGGRAVFLLLILFFSTPFLFAYEERTIKVGVCKLESSGGEDENLAYGLSNRLYEALSGLQYRQLEYSEIISILKRDKEKELSAKKLALDKILKERDELLFKEEPLSSSEKKIDEKNNAVRAMQSEINQLKEELLIIQDEVDVHTISLQPIQVLSPEEGNLFKKKPGAIEYSADFYGLDLVVYGSFEPVDDYIIINIKVWNNLLRKNSAEWEAVARFNEVSKYTNPGIERVLEGVMGRDWAYLSIETGENGIIYIDNRFVGVERVENIRVESGILTVSTSRPGFMTIKRIINLEPGQRENIVLQQVKDKSKDIIIQTFPQGADLYIDSQWTGVTPQRLVITDFPAAVRIKKEGWIEKKLFLGEQSGGIVNINLKPELLERKSLIDDNRSRFYNSFGGFIMSIPLTAWMYGLVEQSADAYNRESVSDVANFEELRRLQQLNQMEYGLYIGAIGLNIFLILDTIIHGVEYINSVDYDSN